MMIMGKQLFLTVKRQDYRIFSRYALRVFQNGPENCDHSIPLNAIISIIIVVGTRILNVSFRRYFVPDTFYIPSIIFFNHYLLPIGIIRAWKYRISKRTFKHRCVEASLTCSNNHLASSLSTKVIKIFLCSGIY